MLCSSQSLVALPWPFKFLFAFPHRLSTTGFLPFNFLPFDICSHFFWGWLTGPSLFSPCIVIILRLEKSLLPEGHRSHRAHFAKTDTSQLHRIRAVNRPHLHWHFKCWLSGFNSNASRTLLMPQNSLLRWDSMGWRFKELSQVAIGCYYWRRKSLKKKWVRHWWWYRRNRGLASIGTTMQLDPLLILWFPEHASAMSVYERSIHSLKYKPGVLNRRHWSRTTVWNSLKRG